jgi:hypothetical protein
MKEEKYMCVIIVVPDGNKFKVLHNYIQHGVSYSTQEQADKEALILKNKLVTKKA